MSIKEIIMRAYEDYLIQMQGRSSAYAQKNAARVEREIKWLSNQPDSVIEMCMAIAGPGRFCSRPAKPIRSVSFPIDATSRSGSAITG